MISIIACIAAYLVLGLSTLELFQEYIDITFSRPWRVIVVFVWPAVLFSIGFLTIFFAIASKR